MENSKKEYSVNPYIYIPPHFLKEPLILKESFHLHHLRALRLKEGDRVTLFDGEGKVYESILKKLEKKNAILKIEASFVQEPQKVRLFLFQAIPKMGKMRQIINECAQIGVWCIHPIKTERTISNAGREKIHQWQKIAISATEQSRGVWLTKIGEEKSFNEAIDESSFCSIRILLHEKASLPLIDAIKGFSEGDIALFVGPEGGFTEEEVRKAKEAGFFITTLGARILRTQLASLLASFLILYHTQSIY